MAAALTMDEAMAVLANAGWTPNRKVNASQWVTIWRHRGVAASSAAVAFLSEFGGLEVVQSGIGVKVARVRFIIDPVMCHRISAWIREFEIAGLGPFFPIGEAGSGGEGTLVIDMVGDVYLTCVDGLGNIALRYGSGYDAMLNLIRGEYLDGMRIDESSSGGLD